MISRWETQTVRRFGHHFLVPASGTDVGAHVGVISGVIFSVPSWVQQIGTTIDTTFGNPRCGTTLGNWIRGQSWYSVGKTNSVQRCAPILVFVLVPVVLYHFWHQTVYYEVDTRSWCQICRPQLLWMPNLVSTFVPLLVLLFGTKVGMTCGCKVVPNLSTKLGALK